MNPTILLLSCLLIASISAILASGAILSLLVKKTPAWAENCGTLKIAAAIALPGWIAGLISFFLLFAWMV